jgi:SAM-dependent methyltransferase
MTDYDSDAFDAFEARAWAEKEAARYDGLAGRVTSRMADPLLDAVGAKSGRRVLDVATGPGYVAARAAERGAIVVGVDFSDTMLSFARARHPGVEFRNGNALALPFADGSFDAVVAAFLLLHLGQPERAVAEANRVVAPGGRAAFTVWDGPARSRWLGVLFDALADAGATPPADLPAGPPIFRFADDREFRGLLEGAGFSAVSVEVLEYSLHVDSADELWIGLVDGTVRFQPLVRSQSDEVQSRIRARFGELLDEYRAGDGFELPVSVKLASGTRAS